MSSSVFQIANGLTRLSIDSSALLKTSSNSKPKPTIRPTESTSLSILSNKRTPEESKASAVILLNKLLLSPNSNPVIINQFFDILINDALMFPEHTVNISADDISTVVLTGISVILDHIRV